ncbi:MAG: hypothetical protein ACFFDQ_12770 [Candidatus Thorarchaeota archaeon]
MAKHSLDSLRDILSQNLDPEKLEKEMEDSQFDERLVLVGRFQDYKLGIVVRKDINGHLSYTLELLLSALHNFSEVDVNLLKKTSRIARTLAKRNYSLHHQGDGWILCEKSLEYSQILSECTFLIEELE